MDNFSTLVIQTRCTIILQHGDILSCTIDAASKGSGWIHTAVNDGELVVYSKPEDYGYLILHGCFPEIRVTYTSLTELKMLDRCFVRSATTLALHQLGIVVKEGNLDIIVDAFSIDCTTLKSGHAKISGETVISRVLANQSSVYDGGLLEASEGTVHAHGESIVSVWFTEELEVGLFGRSKMKYRGDPRMKVRQIDAGCTLKKVNIID